MLILASGSETRAEILRDFGIVFEQRGCDFDEEKIKERDPRRFVYKATMGKYDVCKTKLKTMHPILVADTVVTAGGVMLRKAKDEADARRILELQSGNEVAILTCMVYESRKLRFVDLSATFYRFAPFEKEAVDRYLRSREWRGKAGACMVEGFCKPYIREVRGLESTAMGLSIEKLLPFMDR